MSFYLSSAAPPHQFRLILSSFQQAADLPFAEVLSEAEIARACADEGVEFGSDPDDIYTPALVLWAFLSQMLFKEEQLQLRGGRCAGHRVAHRIGPAGSVAQYGRRLQGAPEADGRALDPTRAAMCRTGRGPLARGMALAWPTREAG